MSVNDYGHTYPLKNAVDRTANAFDLMTLNEEFEKAVEDSKKLPERPDNETLLELYALYKQALEGDVTGERPGGFDFKAIAKYDAWASKKSMSRDDARRAYIALVQRLENQAG